MRSRTPLVLGALVLGLVAFIAFYERDLPSSGELLPRQKHLLTTLVRERLTRIEILSNGVDLALTKRAVKTDEPTTDLWAVESPIHADADDESVEALLGALEWADSRRKFESVGAKELREFGLDHPRARVVLKMGKETISLSFGSEDARGEGVYAATGDVSHAFVVGKDVYEAVTRGLDYFRAKELFGHFSTHRSTNIKIAIGAASMELLRSGNEWRARDASVETRGDRQLVEKILDNLDSARIRRFLPGETEISPVVSIDMVLGIQAPDGGVPPRISLAVGGKCAGHDDEREARLANGNRVCVAEKDVQALLAISDVDALRMHRLTDVTLAEIAGIVITADAGHQQLSVRATEDGWHGTLAFHGQEKPVDVDAEAVSRYVAALSGVAGTQLVTAPAEAEIVSALRVDRIEGAQPLVFEMLRASDGTTCIRPEHESICTVFDAAFDALFEANSALFRSLVMTHENDNEAVSIEIVTHEPTLQHQSLTRDARGKWIDSAAPSAPVDAELVRAFLLTFSNLRAEHLVFTPDDRAQMRGPATEVRITYKNEKGAHSLVIKFRADESPNTWSAWLCDAVGVENTSAHFVVRTAIVDALSEIYIDHELSHRGNLRGFALKSGTRNVLAATLGEHHAMENVVGDASVAARLFDNLDDLAAGHIRFAQADDHPAIGALTLRDEAHGERVFSITRMDAIAGQSFMVVRHANDAIEYWLAADVFAAAKNELLFLTPHELTNRP